MAHQLPLQLKLEEHTRLDDYVGDVAPLLDGLGEVVVLYGPRGSGKSHLLQGLCRNEGDKGRRAVYLTDLTSLDASILEGLETAELVCLDNVHQLLGNDAWERALFHLFNACRDTGSKLVLSSTIAPGELVPKLADLASRLAGSYHLMTDELDDAGKLEVIRRKAHRRGFNMNEDVCRFILARASRDMHHLSHLVEQLDEATLRNQKKVTIPFVKQALGL